ncbi:MAG: hypothetical protein M0Q93_00515 [Terrimicrobiaceae bacterium]|nr:hypothetical protein [Terrimicrobiaceae bacterium]
MKTVGFDRGSLLVCLPFWDGDWEQARKVALLLSDLLPEKQKDCELMFVSRFDAKQADTTVVMHCMEKFANVYSRKSRRRGVGFPMGCNELAFDIFDHVSYSHSLFPQVRCILIVESDCVMLTRTWSQELFTAWKFAELDGKSICGNLIPGNATGGPWHVNAVSMYSWDIVKKIPQLIGAPGTAGWDYYHGPHTTPYAVDTPLIYMDYKRSSISATELFKVRKKRQVPVLYHGVKDDSAIQAVRKKFSI